MFQKKKTEVYALGQNISMSAHKARRVIDQIRGRSYLTTLFLLKFMPYGACSRIFKLVWSAAANARHLLGSKNENLFISQAEVNEGTSLKRFQLRARGCSYPIKRPTCHITIVMKDRSLNNSEKKVKVFLDADNFLVDADDFVQKDFMNWLKNPITKPKNKYLTMEYDDMYSNGGAWDKK
uniref:Large ribosomal subunit protein uL22c n=2 Tax=Adenophora TaxID=82270 RepID=A0A8F9RAI1_9ASTR|nr:ribosomal protein L22 [Adenophora racemosa]QYJ56481.1 ribosomal protein L22 [Adenophora kayasanensis]